MITEVLGWGLEPMMVTTDAWYSSGENLKFLKNKDLGCLMGVAKNKKYPSMVEITPKCDIGKFQMKV